MAEPQPIKAESVQAWLVQPTDDGLQMALVLKVTSGTVAFAFSNDDFARFAAKLLGKAATMPLLTLTPPDGIQTALLKLENVSFESDTFPAPTVTILSQLRTLRLALSVDSNTLLQSFKQFLDRRRAARDDRL